MRTCDRYCSSATTRTPAGVEITHRGVCTNVLQMVLSVGLDWDTASVSWLPLFHDMGLLMIMFPALFGAAWKTAGTYLVAIAPMALAQFTGACVSSALVVLERQDLALVREVVRSLLFGAGLAVAYLLEWDARRAVCIFGFTGTLAYGFYGWITWLAIRRHDADEHCRARSPGLRAQRRAK